VYPQRVEKDGMRRTGLSRGETTKREEDVPATSSRLSKEKRATRETQGKGVTEEEGAGRRGKPIQTMGTKGEFVKMPHPEDASRKKEKTSRGGGRESKNLIKGEDYIIPGKKEKRSASRRTRHSRV